MFVNLQDTQTKELQEKIISAFKSKLRNQINFAVDKKSHIACYIDGVEPFVSLFFVTDNKFSPQICFKVNSYIEGCAISENGKFVLIKTYRNQKNNEDSGVIIILDVEIQKEIGRPCFETGIGDYERLQILEKEKTVITYQQDVCLIYTFLGLLKNKEALKQYYKLPELSPYIRNDRVNFLLDSVANFICDWCDVKQEVYVLLDMLNCCIDMSHYQLSITYRKLGRLLLKQDDISGAITAYEAGLILNPKLGVKKELARLKKEYPNISIKEPKINIIEKEKKYKLSEYELPSTFDETRQKKIQLGSYRNMEQYKSAPNELKIQADIMYAVAKEFAKEFIESLKPSAMKFCETIPNLESMSDKEFSELFNILCSYLDENMIFEARKSAESRIFKHSKNDAISVRQEIISDLHSMIKSFCNINLKKIEEVIKR